MGDLLKIIQTSKGNCAIVDDEDYEWLLKYKWHENKGYAQTHIKLANGKRKHIGMHRIIMGDPEGKEIDHINGIKHDNRKDNLRIATKKQNSWNVGKRNYSTTATSQYKGIWNDSGKYIVTIVCDGKKEHIGTFTNELAAANAYNYYAKKNFEEFAKLNKVSFMEKSEWESFKYKTTSKFTGVYWNDKMKSWAVNIYDKNKKRNTSYFKDEIIAANYYNHLTQSEINQCEFISLEECEKLKSKKSKISIYNGVTFDKRKNRWYSYICYEKQKYYLGSFKTEIEAALAFNNKAIELNIENLDKKLNIIEGVDEVE